MPPRKNNSGSKRQRVEPTKTDADVSSGVAVDTKASDDESLCADLGLDRATLEDHTKMLEARVKTTAGSKKLQSLRANLARTQADLAAMPPTLKKDLAADEVRALRTDLDRARSALAMALQDLKNVSQQLLDERDKARSDRARADRAKAEEKLHQIATAVACPINHRPMTHPVSIRECGHTFDRSSLELVEREANVVASSSEFVVPYQFVPIHCPLCLRGTKGSVAEQPTSHVIRDVTQILFPDLSYVEPDEHKSKKSTSMTESEFGASLRAAVSKFDEDMNNANDWAQFVAKNLLFPAISNKIERGGRRGGFICPVSVFLKFLGTPSREQQMAFEELLQTFFPSAQAFWTPSGGGISMDVKISDIKYREFIEEEEERSAKKAKSASAAASASASTSASVASP